MLKKCVEKDKYYMDIPCSDFASDFYMPCLYGIPNSNITTVIKRNWVSEKSQIESSLKLFL